MIKDKKVILSGIQSSGQLTLGNYIGAIKNWLDLQDDYFCLYMVADLHSITVRQDPKELHRRALEVFKLFVAAGIDIEKNILFFQSHVPAHAELNWILNCYTYMGELQRMTQYKDKSNRCAENNNAGLFTYPVLMASDILLYQADLVPVGEDQKQHLEICRNIAERFNGIYGNIFTIPEPYIPKTGARIMSLQDPAAKMSKSDPNPNGFIALLDSPDVIAKKIRRAVTDSEGEVRFAEDKDGVNNLMNIYSSITKKTYKEIEQEFSGMGYGTFKDAVAQVVIDEISPLQAKFEELSNDPAELERIYTSSGKHARAIAERTIKKAYDKIGFVGR